MELTRDLLEARREELQLQLDSLRADLNAVDGALQQVRWCLEKLDEEPSQPGTVVELVPEEVPYGAEGLAE